MSRLLDRPYGGGASAGEPALPKELADLLDVTLAPTNVRRAERAIRALEGDPDAQQAVLAAYALGGHPAAQALLWELIHRHELPGAATDGDTALALGA